MKKIYHFEFTHGRIGVYSVTKETEKLFKLKHIGGDQTYCRQCHKEGMNKLQMNTGFFDDIDAVSEVIESYVNRTEEIVSERDESAAKMRRLMAAEKGA